MGREFRPQRSERLASGLMDDSYSFHKSLWTWSVDDNGYLVVKKKKR